MISLGKKHVKVMVWGESTEIAMWLGWIEKRTEIAGYVSSDKSKVGGKFRQKLIVDLKELCNCDFDYLVVPTAQVGSITKSLSKEGFDNEDKIKTINELTSSVLNIKDANELYHRETVENQKTILKRVLKSTDREVLSRDWLLDIVKEYGIYCYSNNYLDWNENINWNMYGLLQMPEEFAGFLATLGSLKIDTAIEIGVAGGRSSYIMSAMIYRRNKNVSYTMVDIFDNLDCFDEYNQILPCLHKAIPTTSDDYRGKEFDFVFIDADHSYDAALKDYENVGRFSKKIVAFHDIYANEYNWENGGTVRLWEDIQYRTQDKEHRIFSKFPRRWMGIGAVII